MLAGLTTFSGGTVLPAPGDAGALIVFVPLWTHIILWDIPIASTPRLAYRKACQRAARVLSLEHGWNLFAGNFPAAFWSETLCIVARAEGVEVLRWTHDVSPKLTRPWHRHRARKLSDALTRNTPPLRHAFCEHLFRECSLQAPVAVLAVVQRHYPSEVPQSALPHLEEVYRGLPPTGYKAQLLGIQEGESLGSCDPEVFGSFGTAVVEHLDEKNEISNWSNHWKQKG